MYRLNITETCLKTGYSKRFDFVGLGYKNYLDNFCKQRGIDINKINSSIRRVKRGTSKGIKVFYNPQPGIRIYVWIEIYEKRLEEI